MNRMIDILTPAWAVHFHADGQTGHSSACYDARCGIPPLGTSEEPRFASGPPSRPLMATRRGVRSGLRWPAASAAGSRTRNDHFASSWRSHVSSDASPSIRSVSSALKRAP